MSLFPAEARMPVTLVIPGSINTATGGYRYDRRVVAGLRALGHDVAVIEVGGGFPSPTEGDIAHMRTLIADQARNRVLLVDGLIYSATGNVAAALHASGQPVVALIHHPLSLEAGLTPDTVARLRASEIAALSLARHIIVTSAETRDRLTLDFAVPTERIAIALPGIDRPPVPVRPDRTCRHLLTVASFIPRKGYLDLVAAYAEIRDLDWRATFIGGMGFDPAHVEAIRRAMAAAGLGDRITMLGEVDEAELEAHYAEADLFVLATYYEGYGMAFAEALVRGLGVIGTTGAPAAIGDGGDKVTPGDVVDLANVLRRAIATPDGLARLRRMAAKRAPQLPDWHSTARIFSEILSLSLR